MGPIQTSRQHPVIYKRFWDVRKLSYLSLIGKPTFGGLNFLAEIRVATRWLFYFQFSLLMLPSSTYAILESEIIKENEVGQNARRETMRTILPILRCLLQFLSAIKISQKTWQGILSKLPEKEKLHWAQGGGVGWGKHLLMNLGKSGSGSKWFGAQC